MRRHLSTRCRLVVLALGLALCGCSASGGRGASDSAAVSAHVELPRWQQGTTYRYQTSLHSEVGFEPATRQGFDFGLSAIAELTPVRVEGDEVELVLQLTDLKLSSRNAAQPGAQDAMLSQLREPHMFTLKGGRLHASRVAANVDGEGGSVLRSLAAAFQLSGGPSSSARWQVAEVDATGEHTAEYTAEGNVLRKKKVEYTRLNVAGDITDAMRRSVLPKVLESDASLAVRDGSLQSAKLRERVRSAVTLDQKVEVKTEIELLQLGRAPAKVLDLASLRATLREVPASSPITNVVRKNRFDDIRVGGLTFENIVSALETEQAKLERLDAAEDTAKDGDKEARQDNTRARLAGFSAMAALLRQDPAALPKALAAIRAGSPVRETLLDAIGSSGTPQAQRALLEVMSDAALAEPLRLSAAMSLIRVKEPLPESVTKLSALVGDPLLREYAVYGLGTASRRLRLAGSTAVANEASDAVRDVLATAKDDDTRMLALRGLSNSADVRAMPVIKPWLTNEASGVRQAALDALRLMDDPDADAWIAERLLEDESAAVQASAIAAAGSRSPSQRVADALTKTSLGGKDAIVRHRAVELATRWVEAEPQLTTMLEQVAKDEPEQQIRAIAEQALAMAKVKRE